MRSNVRVRWAARLVGLGLVVGAASTLLSCAGTRPGVADSSQGQSDERLDQLRGEVRAMVGSARDKVFPALVNIEVVTLEYSGGKEEKNRGTGSGTIISPDGLVLTNAHVTDQGYRFFVTLADKQRVPATLVGEDPWTDLAVIRIDTAKLTDPKKPLAHASFGNSDELAVGDYVLAMGSPFALSRTVTLGIVSNVERVFTSGRDAGELDEMLLNWEQRTGLFTNWIQHDALINPGNSGGPLVSLQGKVVGVNTRGGSGMAFATPSNMARQVADHLIASGSVPRSSIGLSLRHIQNTGIDSGVLVDSVDDDEPAAKAGLQAGDVIKSIDGQPVNVRFVEEIPALLKRIADTPIGGTIRIAYERRGQSAEASIVTEKLRRDKGEEVALRVWGVTAQRITERAAQIRKLGSTRGALVSSIRSGSPAAIAEPALGWGDVVVGVDGKPIETINDLVAAYSRIEELKDKPEFVLVNFKRQGKDFLTLIKPKPEDRPDPPPELPKAWIGVATQPVIRNMAEKLGSRDFLGFRVTRVYTGTQAEKAGLRVGDIITAVDGKRLSPKNLAEAGIFTRAVKDMSIDAQAALTVVRDGQSLALPVVLEAARRSPEELPRERDRDFELAVREITFFDREDARWDESVKGVLVDSADPAGWAGLGGIAGGDLIQRIGDQDVTDRATFKKAMEQIKASQPERVVFVIFRGSRTFFRFVEPDWKPTTRKSASE